MTNMNPAPELGPQLKQLRLSGILDSLEARIQKVSATPHEIGGRIEGKVMEPRIPARRGATP